MQHHHDGGSLCAVQLAQQVEHLDLVTEIEERGRLVQEEDPRVLGEGHRDPGALALPAGEVAHRPVGELRHPRAGKGGVHDR